MISNFSTTNNYQTPPAGSTISAFYSVFPTDVGVTTNINPPSGAPVTNSWQGLIVDARLMTAPCLIVIGQQALFTLNIMPGAYQSFQIPAFTQPMFTIQNALSGQNFSKQTGTQLNLQFVNYPILPQLYGNPPSIFNFQVGVITGDGTEQTGVILGGPFRFVQYNVINGNGSGEAQEINVSLFTPDGLHYQIVELVPPDSNTLRTLWQSEDVGINFVSFVATLATGTQVLIILGN
jgi:hypothetical protein